ncbi:MAG: Flp family type IVb pilin [Rhizobiales bacterium]|nr:Flp family type IVb pilin [Hyphomicrobiales bacterium]
MKQSVLRFLANQSGATAIEYGLIMGGIALAILAAIQGVGSSISSVFGRASNALQ